MRHISGMFNTVKYVWTCWIHLVKPVDLEFFSELIHKVWCLTMFFLQFTDDQLHVIVLVCLQSTQNRNLHWNLFIKVKKVFFDCLHLKDHTFPRRNLTELILWYQFSTQIFYIKHLICPLKIAVLF